MNSKISNEVLKARALVAQASRSSSKLQAAVQQLEGEASAALTAHNADAASWTNRMRMVAARSQAQTAGPHDLARSWMSPARSSSVVGGFAQAQSTSARLRARGAGAELREGHEEREGFALQHFAKPMQV